MESNSSADFHLPVSELSKLAMDRAKLYQLLSIIYIQPVDCNFLNSLERWDSLLKFSPLNEVLPAQMVEGLKKIHSFLQQMSIKPSDGLSPNLSLEFTRLFRGVKPGYGPPPPFESVYRGSGQVMGEVTSAVLEKYQKAGLGVVAEYEGEPSDHLSLELDFMRYLCIKESEARSRGDIQEALELLEQEKIFLGEHLTKWVGNFCNAVKKHDELGFYRGMAEFTEGWIGFDYEQIDDYWEMTSLE